MGSACNADCSFCIAKTRDTSHRERNLPLMVDSAIRIAKYCHSVEFLGGEPLFYINRGLRELSAAFLGVGKRILTTNGLRDVFLDNIPFLSEFDHVNVSRHGVSDSDNERVLHTHSVLRYDDYSSLPEAFKRKLRMNVTCHKGGISSATRVMEFVDAFESVGVRQFMFANLNKLPDGFYASEVEMFTRSNRLDNSVFDDVEQHLRQRGFTKVRESVGFGYKVRVLVKGETSVVLKENDDTEIRRLLDSLYKRNRVVLDLILTPSGRVYTDWFLANEF
jgi:molybdenum cofactor biosynthesis enzyme MoaA